jgi:hypothetical protein
MACGVVVYTNYFPFGCSTVSPSSIIVLEIEFGVCKKFHMIHRMVSSRLSKILD